MKLLQKLILNSTVINNNNYLAYSLLDQSFDRLETLIIINCKRILLDSVREVSINKEKDSMYLLGFLETVFSKQHVLHYIFKFNVPPVNRATDLWLMITIKFSNCTCSVLDLSNNTWLYRKFPIVLLHTPCLKYLDLCGIVIEKNLDFEPLNSLEAFKLDYFLKCTQSLRTICPQNFKQLSVTNLVK